MEVEDITCPDCGEAIESEDQLEEMEVREIVEKPKGGIGYTHRSQSIYLCRKCDNPLGHKRRQD